MKHPVDFTAIVLLLAGLSGSGVLLTLGDSIDTLWPGHGKQVVAFLSVASIVAAQIVRINQNPTPPPGTASAIVASSSVTPVLVEPAPPKGP